MAVIHLRRIANALTQARPGHGVGLSTEADLGVACSRMVSRVDHGFSRGRSPASPGGYSQTITSYKQLNAHTQASHPPLRAS